VAYSVPQLHQGSCLRDCYSHSLCRQDTSLSTFDHPISSAAQASHDTKRAKLSDASDQTTIGTLIEDRAYTAIEEIVKDIDTATAGITEHSKESLDGDQIRPTSRESQPDLSGSINLKREFDKLIQREMIRRPDTIITSDAVKDEPTEEDDISTKMDSSHDNVLSLLASTQPPKQLFTSIRKPANSSQPLDAAALPNGMTTTKVIPQHSINEDGKKPTPTLKDLFAPPSSLPPLNLPKQSRHTATRSSSVNWYNPVETESKSKPNRRDGYTNQGLSTGQWLKYSVAPSPTQLTSPETKRKQRDRALSVGEPQTALSQEAIETHHQAKEDALFRSVYSSFAPGRDDFGAVVPEQQKNKLWWKKHGEIRYHEMLESRDDGLAELEVLETNGVADEEPLDEKELQAAIASWQPADFSQEMQAPKTVLPGTDREADELLEEVSDLLETLHSHQRIRNLTLANNGRPITGQNPQPSNLAGGPTSPSTAEFDIYEMLKNQLTLIVSTLPPYLLSKLDGDKMGNLQISTNVQVESKNQKGVLEESDASAVARRSATPGAAAVGATQTPSSYSNIPARSNSYLQASTPAQQYSRAGYGPSTAPRPAASTSYLQNPQYSNRPASSSYSSSAARPSYQYPAQGAAASSTPRYNYGQQYGQQQTHPSYGSYQNGYRPYPGQNMNSYNYNGQLSASQARAPSNTAQASPQAYRGTPAEYQQRAVPPQGYGYGSAQGGGSASPQNQHRPSYSNQPSQGSTQQRPPLYQRHSSQYQSQPPGSPQVNGATSTGSPAPQVNTTADEQAATASKQKVLLAEHQSRQGSGTPQPGSRQYTPQQDGARQNGTPVPQPNGIVAG